MKPTRVKPKTPRMNARNKPKKVVDPTLAFARRLRSNLRARAKLAKTDVSEVPTAQELCVWLKSEEPWKCYYTSQEVSVKNINVDHKTPLSLGGTNTISNFCITTSRINKAKGAFTAEEFEDILSFCRKWGTGGKYLITRLLKGFMVNRKD